MGIYTIEHGYQKSKLKKRAFTTLFSLTLLIGGGGFLVKQYPIQPPQPTGGRVEALSQSSPPAPKITTPLPWPTYGQSAYGVAGEGITAVSDDDIKAVPIASLAKVITALAVLKEKPLAPGEQGPMITLTEEDVALYNNYLSKDGSVALVEPDEKISQYQALQAMLMPSANNITDSLVIWAFGSMDAYTAYANKMVNELGLQKTSVADASGFSASTTGSANDMVKLGLVYMQDPVLRDIAKQTEASIPVAGIIQNYNSVSNKQNLLGIKVGNTDEAGRCFMLANVHSNGSSKDVVSVTVVLGAPNLDIAMKDAQAVIAAGDAAYDQLPL
ncbi:MAG: D-alanyl-D-alanine carboxypeptidase family protein [Candidatus Saccharimonadales bacterium]